MTPRDPIGCLPSIVLLVAMVAGVYAVGHTAESGAEPRVLDPTDCAVQYVDVHAPSGIAGLSRQNAERSANLRHRVVAAGALLTGEVDDGELGAAVDWNRVIEALQDVGR